MNTLVACKRDLVLANRILANQGVMDAWGHVSIRYPDHPNRHIMSQSRSPGIVTLEDLMDFTHDGEPIDQSDRPLYAERFIHGALYEARPDVMAVIHNHSYSVLPFTITDVPLRPVIHVGGLIGEEILVWDIRDKFGETNLLVTDMEKGRDLAQCVGPRSVALMRGHGCVVVAQNLKEAVWKAIYLEVNAKILSSALQMGNVTYLAPNEIKLWESFPDNHPSALDRVWDYWLSAADTEGI